jgi:predicted ABC-type ATPase
MKQRPVSIQKKIVILAGPNGAGKTTFAREFLLGEAECPIFVNADLIAGGLSPFTPELSSIRAGRIAVGWRNFERVYKPLVDGWALYDNSGDAPVLIEAEGRP